MGVPQLSVAPMNPLFRDSSPASGAGGPPAAPSPRHDYRQLARVVRDALRAGRIPSRPADQTWGGPGSGGGCAICSERLDSGGVEYELEFARGAGAGSYRVHVACCMTWEAELS